MKDITGLKDVVFGVVSESLGEDSILIMQWLWLRVNMTPGNLIDKLIQKRSQTVEAKVLEIK